MSAYQYQALDPKGKLVRGVLEADSPRQARTQLRQKKLRPIKLAEANHQRVTENQGLRAFFQPRLSASELTLITRQLSTLVQSGLPIDECLQAIADQSRKRSMKALMLQVRSRVVEGHTLAHSLSQFSSTFSRMYCAMIEAGERSGFLGQVLERLSDYIEQRQYVTQKLKTAMIYPVVLIGVAIAVVIALMVFVLPELIGIFSHSERQLPLLTRVLIGVSDFVNEYGGLVLLIAVILFLSFRRMLRVKVYRLKWHQFLLRIPGISGLLIAVDTGRFASTLSILLGSGVPLLESLGISAQVLGNEIIKSQTIEVADSVREGGSLTRALSSSGYFPPMMVYMVSSGEISGELESMLSKAASAQERELEITLGTVTALFEPFMVIVMGIIVLSIVLAILLPIFELNAIVR